LVLAGSNYWTEGDMKDYCEKNMKKNNIKNINYIQHEDLPKLYSGAELFLSPSLYEGFGLPLVEAMACGCAVVTSNVSSMPEVVGNSGVLVDPKNSISISKAIEKILCNNNLKKHLREKAEARAKKFSWKSFAKNIFDIL